MTFLEYYKENLAHIRHLGAEFAAEFPKIAARLDLNSQECPDPYVERLLEGTAFLAAKVENKLESGYPRLLESILANVAPSALNNQPSYCVLEIQSKKQPCSFPAKTRFQTMIPGVKTPCTFVSMIDFDFTPLVIDSLEYSVRDLSDFSFTDRGGLSVATMRFSGDVTNTDTVDIYLDLPDGIASRVLELFAVGLQNIYTILPDGRTVKLGEDISISLPFMERTVVGSSKISTIGLNNLQEFLAYPAMFKFMRISGLQKFFELSGENSLPLHFVFAKKDISLLRIFSAADFKLGCFPAINLFSKDADRIQISGRYEYQVVPDRTVPLDYEVFQVTSVDFFNESNQTLFSGRKLFDNSFSATRDDECYFVEHRSERLVSAKHLARSSYTGSEMYISFTGRRWLEDQYTIAQVQPKTLCTNRELPLLLTKENIFSSLSAKKITATLAVMPCKPKPPLIQSGDKSSWDAAGMIALNFSSVLWKTGGLPLESLRAIIQAYSSRTEEETELLTEGIKSMETQPCRFRFMEQGCIYYENGWNVRLTLREQAYEGIGLLLFSLILRTLMRNFLPLNAFMKLTVVSDQRGEVFSWQV